MTDSEPKIGDVIVSRHVSDLPFVAILPMSIKVTEVNASKCRELIATGSWVIVDPQPAGEHGPNNEGSNE